MKKKRTRYRDALTAGILNILIIESLQQWSHLLSAVWKILQTDSHNYIWQDVFKVPSVFCHASVIEATELWFVGHISKRLHAPPKFNSSCMPITILQSHCDSALKYSNTDMPYTYNKKLQHKVILVFSLKCYCFRKKMWNTFEESMINMLQMSF